MTSGHKVPFRKPAQASVAPTVKTEKPAQTPILPRKPAQPASSSKPNGSKPAHDQKASAPLNRGKPLAPTAPKQGEKRGRDVPKDKSFELDEQPVSKPRKSVAVPLPPPVQQEEAPAELALEEYEMVAKKDVSEPPADEDAEMKDESEAVTQEEEKPSEEEAVVPKDQDVEMAAPEGGEVPALAPEQEADDAEMTKQAEDLTNQMVDTEEVKHDSKDAKRAGKEVKVDASMYPLAKWNNELGVPKPSPHQGLDASVHPLAKVIFLMDQNRIAWFNILPFMNAENEFIVPQENTFYNYNRTELRAVEGAVRGVEPALGTTADFKTYVGFRDHSTIGSNVESPEEAQIVQDVPFVFACCLTNNSKLGTYGDFKCSHNDNMKALYDTAELVNASYMYWCRDIPVAILQEIGMEPTDHRDYRQMLTELQRIQAQTGMIFKQMADKKQKLAGAFTNFGIQKDNRTIKLSTKIYQKRSIGLLQKEYDKIIERARRRQNIDDKTQEVKWSAEDEVSYSEPEYDPSGYHRSGVDPDGKRLAENPRLPFDTRITADDAKAIPDMAPFVGMKKYYYVPNNITDGAQTFPAFAWDYGVTKAGALRPMGFPDVFIVSGKLSMHPLGNKGARAHGGVIYFEEAKLVYQASDALRSGLSDRVDDSGEAVSFGRKSNILPIPDDLKVLYVAQLQKKIEAGESLLRMPQIAAPAAPTAIEAPFASSSSSKPAAGGR